MHCDEGAAYLSHSHASHSDKRATQEQDFWILFIYWFVFTGSNQIHFYQLFHFTSLFFFFFYISSYKYSPPRPAHGMFVCILHGLLENRLLDVLNESEGAALLHSA